MSKHQDDDLMHVLMYGRRAAGGSAPGNMPSNSSQYKRGGPTHKRRHRRAEGGAEGVNPVTGDKVSSFADINPQNKYKGGRSCYAEGDTVSKAGPLLSMTRLGRSLPFKDGGDTKMKRGGPKHRNRYDAGGSEGGEDREDYMRHGGPKKKSMRDREHHDFGDTVGNILSGIAQSAPMWLPMLLKNGGDVNKRSRYR